MQLLTLLVRCQSAVICFCLFLLIYCRHSLRFISPCGIPRAAPGKHTLTYYEVSSDDAHPLFLYFSTCLGHMCHKRSSISVHFPPSLAHISLKTHSPLPPLHFALTGGLVVPHFLHFFFLLFPTCATRRIITLMRISHMNWQDVREKPCMSYITSVLTVCQGLISLEILEMWVCSAVGRWNVWQRYLPSCSGKLELRAAREEADSDEVISADLCWQMWSW